MAFTLRNKSEGVLLIQDSGGQDFYLNRQGGALRLDDDKIKLGNIVLAKSVSDFTAIYDDVAGSQPSVESTMALIHIQLLPYFGKETPAFEVSGVKSAKVTYDFAVDAGAVGEIDLGNQLPAGAQVTGVIMDEETTMTSSGNGATLELKLGPTATGDGSITDVLTGDNSNTGITEEDVLFLKKTTIPQKLYVEIKVEDLTAGKVNYTVSYVQ